MLEEHEDSITNNTPLPDEVKRISAKTIENTEELFRTYQFDDLDKWSIYGYGVGHFLNDLTASFWFKYITIYLVFHCFS
jgi:hypothetical protein